MTDMEMTHSDGDHVQFKLGPVERWVIVAAVLLLVFLLTYVFHSFDARLETQAQTMQTVVTQQAVTNAQLQTLSQQLADVPGLTRNMATIQAQVERNTSDIRDLQQTDRSK
jgi:uncharacterized membrane protein